MKNSVDMAIITVKDTYFKEYLDAIKIIDITDNLSGRISTTIRMLKAAVPIVVDSSDDTIIQTLPEQNASANDIAEILIPADSFYTKEGDKYSGKVSYKMTFIDPVDTNTDDIPGQFEFVDEEGSNIQLASNGVFNIQIEGDSGQELIVDDVIDVSFASKNEQNLTLWKMNEATGKWEPLILGTESKRRKRRRTEGLIGEIDMSQLSRNTWINLDYPWSDIFENTCFFKIRVYKDEALSEEVTNVAQFRMEFHKIEDKILKSYSQSTEGSGTRCFPASCKNEYAYIRIFFDKVTAWEDERDLYAVDITNFPLSSYDIADGNKTLKVQMTSDEIGPFYNNEATCLASGISDNHLRFRLETQYDFTYKEVTPPVSSGLQPLPLDQLQAIQPKVWYPLIEKVHTICTIKINVTIETDNYNLDYSKIRFNVVSQGDYISNTKDFVFGIREFIVDATSSDTTYCVEYKCSGVLEGSNAVVDYTRIKIGVRQPSPLHCHVRSMQSALKTYKFGSNKEERNLLTEHENHWWWVHYGFDGYAPTVYGPSYGIYDETTDDPTDRKAGRDAARLRCLNKCKSEISDAAFTLFCH